VFFPGKPFIRGLMFADNAKAYLSEVPFISFIVLLNVIILNVVMLIDFMLNVGGGGLPERGFTWSYPKPSLIFHTF
jgi:hypothetical protein